MQKEAKYVAIYWLVYLCALVLGAGTMNHFMMSLPTGSAFLDGALFGTVMLIAILLFSGLIIGMDALESLSRG